MNSFNKLPVHLRIVGDVIVRFGSYLMKVLSFSAYKKELILNSGRYFGSMFNNSLAHPQVVENVMPHA